MLVVARDGYALKATLLSIPFANVLYGKKLVRGILSGSSRRLSIVSYQSQVDLPYTF
jgi:hypothetical protein